MAVAVAVGSSPASWNATMTAYVPLGSVVAQLDGTALTMLPADTASGLSASSVNITFCVFVIV